MYNILYVGKYIKKLSIVLMLIFLFFLYATIIEPSKLVLKKESLYLSNWDAKLDGLKIAVISDLHIGFSNSGIEKINTIVEKVNNAKPDIIFILGDLDALSIYNTNSKEQSIEVLSKLKAPLGVVSVLGNHDYEPQGVVKPILIKSGAQVLEDTKIEKSFNGVKFDICGTRDIWHYSVNPSHVLGKINKPTIFLSHNPDIFPKVPSEVALTLSGHTHGGEVSFPLLGAPFVPSKYSHKYVKGHIIEKNKHLFVSSGVATLSRFRMFNPPEIVLLQLFSQDKNLVFKDEIKYGLSDLFYRYNNKKYGSIIK